MATLMELKKEYYATLLGYPLTTSKSLTDLEFEFFTNPPAGGGGEPGGDPIMGGDLSGTASNAQIVAGAVGITEINSNIKDPVAGTAGLRTLGTGAQQAAPGDTSQQTTEKGQANGYASLDVNGRVPTAQLGSGTASSSTYLRGDGTYATPPEPAVGGDLTGSIGNAQIAAGAVGSNEIAAAIKDPVAATAGLRTLGTGAAQAAPGNTSQQTTAKDQANGYPGLDSNALLAIARMPAGSIYVVRKVGGVWPGGDADTGVRPTSRSDITVAWQGPDPSPAIVSSGTGGMLDEVDVRWITP